jgi:hypothetical protein
MAVQDWSTNPDLNTTVGGVFIGEGCPPSNLNNAERQIMAEARTKFDDLDAQVKGVNSGTIAALAALTPATDTLPYFTGATTAAGTALTGLARSILAKSSSDDIRGILQAVGAGAYNPTRNGVIAFNLAGIQFVIQCGYNFQTYAPGQYRIAFNQPYQGGCFVAVPWGIAGANVNGTVLGVAGPDNTGFNVQVSNQNLAGIGWIALGR